MLEASSRLPLGTRAAQSKSPPRRRAARVAAARRRRRKGTAHPPSLQLSLTH